MVSFGYTILYVKDVPASIRFYETAFGFQQKFMAPGDEYGELNTGSTTLAFASLTMAASNLTTGFQPSDPTAKPFAIEVGLVTTDVEGVVQKAVAAGGSLLEKPKVKPWGQTVAYVKDPDGFLIEICTPVG